MSLYRTYSVGAWAYIELNCRKRVQQNRGLAPLLDHIDALGAQRPTFKAYTPTRLAEQIQVLLDERVPVFSFIYGIPPREVLDECRSRGIKTIGTATTPAEAHALQEAGVDVVVAARSGAKPFHPCRRGRQR
jgi:NAD(P)H-dependent flavin oxidoreductase YrpB (nitropropane dioxygenase family)